VEVTTGVIEIECRRLNQAFIKHTTTGLPLVIVKAAYTLDGRIATRTGDARWISNDRSRRFVHRLRCDLDAILVGIETALNDDPLLTARTPAKRCRQPVRIVLDTRLRLPLTSQLVQSVEQSPLWVAWGGPSARGAALEEAGAEVLALPPPARNRASQLLRAGSAALRAFRGGGILGAFLDEDLDEFYFSTREILGDPGPSRRNRDRHGRALRHDRAAFGSDALGRLRERLY
jgi:diaminohydroxyphosphoribosylaminopyrimidine deaminase/5-amino-6-(5-phosphoribosylamino)uracil reductase